MKKNIIAILCAVLILSSCAKDGGSGGANTGSNGSGSGGSGTSDRPCGTYNGHQLYKGSQGGCYYINSNGNKTYVAASICSC